MSEAYLKSVYYNPAHPAGFSTARKLRLETEREAPSKENKISERTVHNWLSGQDVYTLHRPIRRKFKRRKTISRGIHDQWQADLIQLNNLSRYNDNYNFILTVICVFSRKAFAAVLRRKTGLEVSRALEKLFKTNHISPRLLQTDDGPEFFNKEVRALLERYKVKLFSTSSDVKSSMVEAFNKTLLKRLFKYMYHNNTRRYIDILPSVLEAYNSSTHRMIGIAPDDVNKDNEEALWNLQYGPSEFPLRAIYRFKLHDSVRISLNKNIFEKSYKPNWSTEIFKIAQRRATNPVTYRLSDARGELLKGSFYENEMQLINNSNEKDRLYDIDVLKTRKVKGKTEFFVHYRGWPNSFDEWLPKSQIVKK
jgi:transposase InsO family protein